LSFFDETDEPRTASRPTPPRRRPTGGGRRPPSDRQAIQVRRTVAAVALLVLLILVVLGVQSCASSQRVSALKDYNNSVASVAQSSNQTGSRFFSTLAGAQSSGNAAGLQNQIDTTRIEAENQLHRAQGFSVPGEVKDAQQDLLLALRMRSDGIASVARDIQPALANSSGQDAVNRLAADMARFYASDVVYKSYTLTQLASALNSAGISVGGSNGEQMTAGQFLPDIRWLTTSYISGQLHVTAPTSNVKAAPGVHGHKMDSCTVGGTTLATGSTNTIPRSPAPTFTCNFTNDGQDPETNITVKVSVGGTSISGQTVVPQDTPGQQSTAQITLSSAPPAGTYQVSATVEKVPGETVTTHNTLTFPISFQ
jgi:hypothetical protein